MDVDLRSHLAALQVDGERRLHVQVGRILPALPAGQLQVLAHEVARLVTLQGEPARLQVLQVPVQLGHESDVLSTVGIASVEGDLEFVQSRLDVVLWLVLGLRHVGLEGDLELEGGKEEHLLLGAVDLLVEQLPSGGDDDDDETEDEHYDDEEEEDNDDGDDDDDDLIAHLACS